MRLLVCAAGTTGDVHPLVGIAAAMHERGHEVILIANEAYRSLAVEAGVGFEAVGTVEDLKAIRRHPHAWSWKHGWKVWTRGVGLAPMRDYFAAINQRNEPGITVVAASYVCFGARLAREILEVPTATLHLNVHTIRSINGMLAYPPPSFLPENTPPFYVLGEGVPDAIRRAWLWMAESLFINPTMAPDINRCRSEFGLPPLREFVRDWWDSPDLAIGLFPEWWSGGQQADWPDQVVTTGFPFWDRSDSTVLSPDLQRFLDDGDPVLVYSPGASSGHTDAHFQAFSEACGQLGRRGLILTPSTPETDIGGHNIRFERFVPFRLLLPRAAAVVHHAGIGTSAQCLAAGVPQVVVPTLYNQPDTAIRLERLGVAVTIKSNRLSEKTLISAVNQLLNDESTGGNVSRCAALMQENNPLPAICGHLESLV